MGVGGGLGLDDLQQLVLDVLDLLDVRRCADFLVLQVVGIEALLAEWLDAAIMHADVSDALIAVLRTFLLGLDAGVPHY